MKKRQEEEQQEGQKQRAHIDYVLTGALFNNVQTSMRRGVIPTLSCDKKKGKRLCLWL